MVKSVKKLQKFRKLFQKQKLKKSQYFQTNPIEKMNEKNK